LRSQKTDPAAIMLRLYYDGKEFAITSGYSISPKLWNQEKQRATGKYSEDINSGLSAFASKILAIYNEAKTVGMVTAQILKDGIEGKTAKQTTLFYVYVENIIEKKMPQNPKRAQKYMLTFERIKEFSEIYYKRELNFEDLDLNFYSKYLNYLKNDRVLADSTVQSEIKILKRFLNLATIEGVNKNMMYKSTEFKAPSYRSKHIYITDDELNMLYEMKLTGKLEKARDVFIIGCRTGLRVSDYWRCVADTVEKGLICIDDTQKTGEPVFIPMHWQVREILTKYDGKPPVFSDSVLNKYLKKIGEDAKFDNMVKDTRPHKTGMCPKYELITTHTARRSCATNMYLAGFDLYFIQGVLGHTKIETTIKYLGVTRKIVAQKYQNNEYFLKNISTVTV
jgi:site-specific recombinase XerD